MTIKIMGSGCPKCRRLEEKVRMLLIMNSIDAAVEKVTDLNEILKYNILATPALIINERLKIYGNIPKDEDILKWIREA